MVRGVECRGLGGGVEKLEEILTPTSSNLRNPRNRSLSAKHT